MKIPLVHKFEKLYCYIIAILLIVTTRGIWMYDRGTNVTYSQLSRLVSVIMLIGFMFMCLYNHKLRIPRFVQYKLVIAIVCMTVYFLISTINRDVYVMIFVIPFICATMFLLRGSDKNNVWYCFTNVMLVLAVISLIFYIGGTILNIIPPTGMITFDWPYPKSCNNYFNLYYEAQKVNMGGGIFKQRNCGFFTEAPMYNLVLCIAMGVEVFLKTKYNMIKCIILATTIITTQSTTGLLFIIVIVVLSFINRSFATKQPSIKKIIVIMLLVLGGVVTNEIIGNKTTHVSGNNSVQVRTDHLWACLKTFMRNPIYGCGFNNSQGVLEAARYKQGMSVGLPYMLATGGLLLSSNMIIPFVMNTIKSWKIREYEKICFEVSIIILYFFTAVTSTPIMLFFMAYMVTREIGE